MRQSKVIIVGAGIAGLCAGVYARKNGFDTEILEMNEGPGGLATSWRRDGYVFETCLHWLLGSRPGSQWNRLWKEVFDIDSLRFVLPDEFIRIEKESGQSLSIPRDVNLLERSLLEAGPEDATAIRHFVRAVRRLQDCDMPMPGEGVLKAVPRILRSLSALPTIRSYSSETVSDLADRFRNPMLQHFFRGEGSGEMSAIALAFSLAWMGTGDAAYPIGGSQAVIRKIEREYLELGGKIHYGSRVEGLVVKEDRVFGVRLSDCAEVRADWVISAADGHTTLFKWVPERYRDARATAPYRELPTFPSYIQVSFGVRRDLRDLPGFFTRVLMDVLPVDPGTEVDELTFRVFHFDPTFAPPGRTAVTCNIPTTNIDFWARLQQRTPLAYQARKNDLATRVGVILERRVPGIRRDIEQTDVSTPVTVQRFTGNWKGSMEGFLITPKMPFRPLRMHLPRLLRFRMIGQWVMPGGGLPSGLLTARLCIKDICAAERRPFTTAGGAAPGEEPPAVAA